MAQLKNKTGRNFLIILSLFVFLFLLKDKAIWLWDLLGIAPNDDWRFYAHKIFQILIWINAAVFAREVINLIYKWKYAKQGDSPPKLIKDLFIILVFFIDILLIFKFVLHEPVTGIWVTSGTLALVLGFALRNIILDLFSGIAVNIEKPYQIGDWIEVHQRFAMDSLIGQVTEISWRATHISTEQNTNVVIPNSLMTTMVVTTNFWHKSKPTRFEVFLTLDFSVPAVRAKRILLAGAMDAIRLEGFVKDVHPQILIDTTSELGVVYRVRYWITPWQGISPSMAKDHLYSNLLYHLNAAGLTLAYPKKDVYNSEMPSRQLDADNVADRSKLLSYIEIFSILKADEFDQLSRKMTKRIFKPNQIIFNQGDDGNSMFIVFEGLLEVAVIKEQTNIVVATIAPSDYFGEMSLLTGEQRSATIRCVTESVVYEINQSDFMDLLFSRNEIADQIADKIQQRRLRNTVLIEEELNHNKNKNSEDFQKSLISKIKNFFMKSEFN